MHPTIGSTIKYRTRDSFGSGIHNLGVVICNVYGGYLVVHANKWKADTQCPLTYFVRPQEIVEVTNEIAQC